jgi:hypothetical protein
MVYDDPSAQRGTEVLIQAEGWLHPVEAKWIAYPGNQYSMTTDKM